MGCVLHYKGQEFENKATLAEFIMNQQNDEDESDSNPDSFHPEDRLELEKQSERAAYDNIYAKWHAAAGLNGAEQVRVAEFKESNRNSIDLEESIKKMNDLFDVKVILDKSISNLGELLPANHALSTRYGKPVILINPNLARSETVFHEFAHLYVDVLGGSKNPLVQQAMELLQDTDLFKTTAINYPELSGEMLNREVLASALGMQADDIFGKELLPMSVFSRIINKIMAQIASIFGIRENAVRELARELLSKDLMQTPIQKYNTLITQKQINVKGTSQKEVVDYIENYIKKHDGFATQEQKAETKIGRTSVSKLLKNSLYSTSSKITGRKGDIDLVFDKEEYTKDNVGVLLYAKKVPQALDTALTNFFKAKGLIDNKKNKTWFDVIENENFFSRHKRKEAALAKKGSLISNLDPNEVEDVDHGITSMEIVIENLDDILAAAEELQSAYGRGAIAGEIVHDAIQSYIEGDGFGVDVDSPDNKLFNYIEELITSGRAAGSKFYTELAVYNEANNITARIDLLEILADGTFVIHDYKTMKSMNTDYGEKKMKSEDEMFVQTGYVSQLMVYGKILEGYGMKPAAIPFNLIGTQVNYGRLDGDKFRDVTVSGLKSFRFNKSARGNTGLKSKLFEADQKVSRTLSRMRQIQLNGKKENIIDYEKLIEKVSKDMIIYNNLAKKQSKNINDKELRKMAARLDEIKADQVKTDKMKLRMSVDALIEGVADQLSVLESSISEHNDASFDKDFMYSYRYIVQAMDNLEILKETMERDKDNELEFDNREDKLYDIDALIGNITTSKRYYKAQVENHAAYQLANNSNYQRGLYASRFQVRLKKAGVSDKVERERQVESLLRENGDEIFDKEMEYWQTQFREGILDLRSWEYQFADPGISKSQFVQVTKNLIDKANTSTRKEIDFIMPKILKWDSGVSYNKSGSTREIWKDFLEKRKVRGINGETIEDLNGSVIPEYTSDYREQMFTYLTQKEHYLDELRVIKNIEKKTEKDKAEQARIEGILEIFFEERKKQLVKNEKISKMRTLRVNPAFEALSEEKKADLRFIHKNLRDADNRIQNSKLKLTSYFSNKDNVTYEDAESGKGEFIYNLPRQRMSAVEAANSISKTVQNAYSRLKEIMAPAADREDTTFEGKRTDDDIDKEDSTDSFNSSMSDIENNEVYDVPVYFRNSLGKDRDLQSFDIPSLLADNHGTTIAYSENKMIEADLFMISESLRLQGKVLKTDGVFNGKVLGAFNRPRKSDENYVFKAVKNQIENRIYGRHFSGIYTKGSYRAANIVGSLKAITSISVLAGNFMSALNTSGSGSVYRFMEGEVGEHFNRKDWLNGSKKTYADMGNMLSDTQKSFPSSKTILLIRMLGMENQYKALTNKFVNKSFASKNFDQGTLFALTSLAETNITAHLMYSLTGGIKMMNHDGAYINKEGVVVADKKDAMTFDEAYDVVDGVLTLNDKVGFTDKDFSNKFNENGDVNMVALTNISGYVKSVYADLFGQYDHNMKSVFETSVLGAATMSMKKWLPRGLNRRFRGAGSMWAWGENLLDFDQLNEPENEHLKFYSQDQQQFQEGYFVTAARYVRLMAYEMRKTGSKLSLIEKNKQLRDSMSDHEIANLKRAGMDCAYMVMMYAVKTMLFALASGIGTDPRDRIKKERAYFAAYLALKLYHESNAFVNPFSLVKTATDPSVVSGQLFKIAGLADQLFGFTYDKDSDTGFSFNATETYDSGRKEGKLKSVDKLKAVAIPGWSNYSRASGIIGWDDDADSLISDSYKFYVRNQ